MEETLGARHFGKITQLFPTKQIDNRLFILNKRNLDPPKNLCTKNIQNIVKIGIEFLLFLY